MTGRAFVTGAGGFIGSQLVDLLGRAGWEVGGCGRRRDDHQGLAAWWGLDIGDVDALSGAVGTFQPDLIFHLAAVVDTVTTPSVAELYRVNTMGTVALLEAIRTAAPAARLVFASSAFAYGHVTHGAERIAETTPLVPRTPYGASKAAAETIVRQWSEQTGIEAVVARAFQVSGPGHSGPYALAEWATVLTSGAREVRVGRLDVVRDYLDVRDTAAGFLALGTQGEPGRTYNLASGVPVSMSSLLDGLMVASKSAVTVVHDPTRMRPVDQPVFVADIRQITHDTDWIPRIDVKEMLQDLVATRVPQRSEPHGTGDYHD